MITDLKINAERKRFCYEKGYWTEKTLGDVWADRVASHPERTYVSDDQGSSYTYGEIDDKAARLAAWLVEQGVAPGDEVTFTVLRNGPWRVMPRAALSEAARLGMFRPDKEEM